MFPDSEAFTPRGRYKLVKVAIVSRPVAPAAARNEDGGTFSARIPSFESLREPHGSSKP